MNIRFSLVILTFLLCFFNLFSQSVEWIPLSAGSNNGSCSSGSDCDNDLVCYGLRYTSNNSGVISSYTTGFFVDCTSNNNANGNPVFSNSSCIMTDNSEETAFCSQASMVLMNSSGQSGTLSVTAGVPLIIHQICFDLESGQSVNITEDDATDITVSLDTGSGPVDEFPTYSIFSANYNTFCDPLAIQLGQFSASPKNQASLLQWTTLSEIDNDHFVVEWSRDGQFFHEISKIPGAGDSNSPIDYEFLHRQPSNGYNYYRLKAVEYDGDLDYSPIRSALFTDLNEEQFLLFPNPTRKHLNIRLPEVTTAEQVALEIRSLTGQLLIQAQELDLLDLQQFSVANLATGTYFLQVTAGSKQYVERLVKVE